MIWPSRLFSLYAGAIDPPLHFVAPAAVAGNRWRTCSGTVATQLPGTARRWVPPVHLLSPRVAAVLRRSWVSLSLVWETVRLLDLTLDEACTHNRNAKQAEGTHGVEEVYGSMRPRPSSRLQRETALV